MKYIFKKYTILIWSLWFIQLLSCSTVELIPPSQYEVSHTSDSIVFAVIGDYGYHGNDEKKVAELVKSWNPDLIITTGDNNYFEGKSSTLKDNISDYFADYIYNFDALPDYQCNGKAFVEKTNRFYPSPGNHDNNTTDHLIPYLNFFTLPGNERYYSFIWGPVSFFSLNSLPDDVSDQKEWLKKQLEESVTPFNIVYFHHSPYSPGQHGNCEKMQWNFKEMGVDAVLTGHDHLYARVEKNGEEGFYYLVNGAGGCSLYSCDGNILDPNQFDVICYDQNYGAIRGSASSRKVVFEFYSISNTSVPIDRIVLIK